MQNDSLHSQTAMPIFVLMVVSVVVVPMVIVSVVIMVIVLMMVMFLFLLLLFLLYFFLVRKQRFFKAGMFMNGVVFVAMGIGNRLVAQLVSAKRPIA